MTTLNKNLEDDGLVVLAQVVGEDVGVHERLSALTQDVDGLTQELHLDPRHVQLLHLRHLLSNCPVQLTTARSCYHTGVARIGNWGCGQKWTSEVNN